MTSQQVRWSPRQNKGATKGLYHVKEEKNALNEELIIEWKRETHKENVICPP